MIHITWLLFYPESFIGPRDVFANSRQSWPSPYVRQYSQPLYATYNAFMLLMLISAIVISMSRYFAKKYCKFFRSVGDVGMQAREMIEFNSAPTSALSAPKNMARRAFALRIP